MDRRTFLKQAAAAPLVFGLGDLFAQDQKSPAWLAEALARMKDTGRYGIVLIIPDDKEQQRPIGQALAALIDGKDRGSHALFSEAVFVCMRRFAAEGAVCDAGDRNTRYLLDPSGKKIDADIPGENALKDAAAFENSFGPFLHGKDGKRFRERVEEIRKSLPAEVTKAVENLDADEADVRDKASAVLQAHADRIISYLADSSARASSPEARSRAADVVEHHFRTFSGDKPGPRLPFGCKVSVLVEAGCGELREKGDDEEEGKSPVKGCGMASLTKHDRRFLRWLSFLK
jgi:hypothetical protein